MAKPDTKPAAKKPEASAVTEPAAPLSMAPKVTLFGVIKADGPGYAVVKLEVPSDDERLVVMHTRLARPIATQRIESALTHEHLTESMRSRRR
jgi:hypothetical protein